MPILWSFPYEHSRRGAGLHNESPDSLTEWRWQADWSAVKRLHRSDRRWAHGDPAFLPGDVSESPSQLMRWPLLPPYVRPCRHTPRRDRAKDQDRSDLHSAFVSTPYPTWRH